MLGNLIAWGKHLYSFQQQYFKSFLKFSFNLSREFTNHRDLSSNLCAYKNEFFSPSIRVSSADIARCNQIKSLKKGKQIVGGCLRAKMLIMGYVWMTNQCPKYHTPHHDAGHNNYSEHQAQLGQEQSF